MSTKFDKDVLGILESIEKGTDEELRACADKIHALADHARKTKFFIEKGDMGKETFESKTPSEIYLHMLSAIASSPTKFHADGSVILIIPYLSDALKKEDEKEE